MSRKVVVRGRIDNRNNQVCRLEAERVDDKNVRLSFVGPSGLTMSFVVAKGVAAAYGEGMARVSNLTIIEKQDNADHPDDSV